MALVERSQSVRVAEVRDTWLIEDEWWRQPIRRRYYQLLLTNGVIRTVYQDMVTGDWFAQEY